MKKLLSISSFLFLICTFYVGCKKDTTGTFGIHTSDTDQQLIVNAKQFFETNVQDNNGGNNTLTEMAISNQARINPIAELIKNAVWDKAYTLNISIGKIVVVPIGFNDSLFARPSFDDSSTRLTINKLSKLIVYTDSLKHYHSEVVSSFPDKNFINNPTNNFSGIAFVQDWHGNFLKGYQFQNGEIAALSLNTSVAENNVTANAVVHPSDVIVSCTYIDWYTCTGTDEDPYQYCTIYDTEDLGCTITGGGGGGSAISSTEYGYISTSTGGTAIVSANAVFASPSNPVNISQELICFTAKSTSTYSITINVEEPGPGTGLSANTGSVQAGHTYLTFEQDNADGTKIIRNDGFYPATYANTVSPSSTSIFGENSNTGVSAQLKIVLSSTAFMNATTSAIKQTSNNYNLYSNNCTTAALNVLQACNINYLYDYAPGSPFTGDYPGLLGYTIRNLDLNVFSQQNGGVNVTRTVNNTNSMFPPNKQGSCALGNLPPR